MRAIRSSLTPRTKLRIPSCGTWGRSAETCRMGIRRTTSRPVCSPLEPTLSIAAHEFYQDTFVTALESNEILLEIEIPKARPGQGNAYVKLEKRIGDFPIVGVAANLVLATKGTIESAGLALTAVGPTALKATEAERHLVGKAPDDAAFERAAELAQEITSPVSDLRGPAEYKRAMVRVLTLRALHRASARARGGA